MPRPLHQLETLDLAAYARLEAIRAQPNYYTRKIEYTKKQPKRQQKPLDDTLNRPDCPYCEAPNCNGVGKGKWQCKNPVCQKRHSDSRYDYIRQEIAAGRMDRQGNLTNTSTNCPKCGSPHTARNALRYVAKDGTHRRQFRCSLCRKTFICIVG